MVKLIFQLCVEGNGPGKIARMLKERGIPTPGTIEFQRTGRTRNYHPDAPCSWAENSVIYILEQDAYLGRTTNFKTTKLSYKSKKTIVNTPDKWAVFEDTHKAIIDKDTWELVQKAREQRRRPTKMGEMGMFSGLAFCADCGAKLYHCRTTSWTHEQECYTCASYRTKKQCSAHYIRVVVLEQLVLQNLQRVVAYVQEDEDEFVRRVMENKTAVQRAEQEQAKRKLEKQERRISELDAIIQRLYEDHVMGKLSAERFANGVFKHPGSFAGETLELTGVQNARELRFPAVPPVPARDRRTDFSMTGVSMTNIFITWPRFPRFWNLRYCGSGSRSFHGSCHSYPAVLERAGKDRHPQEPLNRRFLSCHPPGLQRGRWNSSDLPGASP